MLQSVLRQDPYYKIQLKEWIAETQEMVNPDSNDAVRDWIIKTWGRLSDSLEIYNENTSTLDSCQTEDDLNYWDTFQRRNQ